MLATLLAPGLARAQQWGTAVYGRNDPNSNDDQFGLLTTDMTDFGSIPPNAVTGPAGGKLSYGRMLSVSGAKLQQTFGVCQLTAAAGQLQVGAYATASGATATITDGNGTFVRKPDFKPSCYVGASAALVSANLQCSTIAGIFQPAITGPGASAQCTCSDGCFAGAYWATGSLSYKTPPFGTCGIQVAPEVVGEATAGLKFGAGTVGTIGARISLGPIGFGAGLAVTQLHLGQTWGCLKDAGRAVVSGIENAGKKVGGFFGGIGGAIGSFFGGGSHHGGGTAVARDANTNGTLPPTARGTADEGFHH